MTEDEWFAKGDKHLAEWNSFVSHTLSPNEESAYLLAWEQAGRLMGVVS